MSEEVSLDFELTKDNKKAIEELLKASKIRRYLFTRKNGEELDLVEYKEYEKIKLVLDKIKERLKEKEENGFEKIYVEDARIFLEEILEEIE